MYGTNCVANDGFGSQYQNIISCILYTEIALGKQFVLSPTDFVTVYMDDAANIEAIMNIDSEFPRVSDIPPDAVIEQQEQSVTYPFVYQHVDTCIQSMTMEKIRKAFHKKHIQHNPFSSITDRVIVAVHVRRPSNHPNIDIPSHTNGHDVKNNGIEHASRVCCRYHTNDRYIPTISAIRDAYASQGKRCLFHIVSEGKPEDYTSLLHDDVVLCINESVEDSFRKLVYADVLVCSFSSFSYSAALLRRPDQTVWHQHDFWCPPASWWNVY
jgi:hypothetical protein